MYINESELECVGNYQHFTDLYSQIVDDCRQCRTEAKLSQTDLAEMLAVNRWRIVEFEQKKKLDWQILFLASQKLGIDIFFNHKIN
jgi:DNA-binding XRE family transcriptional regulator